jgi:hypothetical protein
MKITFSENIGSTPAIVRRDTGEMFLNPKIWFTLPEAYRRFIFYHELGHYTLQTPNELEADHYAFNQIAGTAPESLKNTVRTLYGVLPFTTELQSIRLQNMYRLALTYDQQKQPTAARQAEIRRIENDLLQNYGFNQQLKEYMSSTRKGKPTDYEFPGYDPGQFQPSIGNRFRDIPLTQPVAGTPWPSGTVNLTPATNQLPGTSPVAIAAQPVAVPLSLIPEFALPKSIDLKSVAIGVLVVLAIIGISKL